MRYCLSIAITALCAAATMYLFLQGERGSVSGLFFYWSVAAAAIAGAYWAWFVFPRMGKSPKKDFLWIVAAYPAVAALALIFSVILMFLLPYAPFVYILALIMPMKFLPIFVIGAIFADNLPEREYRLT